jgi:hypothetical protein
VKRQNKTEIKQKIHEKVLTNKIRDGNISSSKEKKNNFIKKGA